MGRSDASGARRGGADHGAGKRLRVAVHYKAADEPPPHEAEAFAGEPGFNDCKLWRYCRGRACRPDYRGKLKFRTPLFLPGDGLPNWASDPKARTLVGGEGRDACPRRVCTPEDWELLALHSDWTFMGRGGIITGALADQPAQTLLAFKVLSVEEDLTGAYFAERARRQREKER